MTAADTAMLVMRWAHDGALGELPEGDLSALAALGQPPDRLAATAVALSMVTQARLRLGPASQGETMRVAAGLVVAAAVLGARRLPGVVQLLDAAPAPRSLSDLTAYHGVVQPAVRWIEANEGASSLTDRLRALSPLTGVLDHPANSGREACLDLLLERETIPGLHCAAAMAMAEPGDDSAQWNWRAEVLGVLRRRGMSFVLDVYESARRHHAARHDAQIRTAMGFLQGFTHRDPARDVADYWQPFADLIAARPDSVRARPDLLGYRDALNLVRRYRLEEAQTP
ncbi:hypothetical protein Rhe02_89550 [Rhizocola hellebori]|uniref:FtsH ternary system domain-containing protein n=1 Tax=Rhizocola hellebori TaxID=1392758 RepID=A0A8J3VM61_9ACTN|nr:hypothetical protein [Rhizocola hellebori]GIH10888.1 hypothetical protein Rhe02_89550 [Rhizocola hellebori]